MGYNHKLKNHKTKACILSEQIKRYNSIKRLCGININEARKEIMDYMADYPSDMYGYFLFGTIEQQLGNLESAKSAFLKVANSDKDNKYSALVKLGDIAKSEGNKREAKRMYKRAVEESPNKENRAIKALARMEKIDKNYDEALSLLRTIKSPDEYTRLEIAKITSLQEESTEALTTLRNKDTKNKIIIRKIELEKGKAAKKQGKIDEARYHFFCALEDGTKDPTRWQTLHELSKLELEFGDTKATVPYCEELIQMGVTFEKEVYLTLGLAKQELGIFDQAFENFKTAITSNASDVRSDGFYHLGSLYFAKGDYEEAIKFLSQSTLPNTIPRSSTIVLLINSYFKLKKYQETEDIIQGIRDTYPEFLEELNLEQTCMILDKVLGRPLPKRTTREYAERQVILYSREDAIFHIKARHTGECVSSKFSKKINIDELFDDIKVQMTEDNKVNTDVMDIYEIDYKDAGLDQNQQMADKIHVVALPDTLDIITMYPSNKTLNPRQGVINEQLAQTKPKVNERINSFNRRFAKFQQHQKGE